MNKNTIVKLIAVLAMCFLIGGALVACKGAAGPAGPQGPQGEKGETGAAGVAPTISIGENGNWFVDGVDLGVKASADAACDEHDWKWIDVEKHTETEAGIYVEVCTSCGFARIGEGIKHVMKAGEIPANCLEAKWVGEFCSVCGFKGENGEFVGEANGHSYTKAQPVTDVTSNVYICVDGGMLVQHCKDCGDIQYTTVEAGEYPCTVYDWDVVDNKLPTEDNYGAATGICTICGELDSIELPFIDSDEYTIKTNKEQTCIQNGEYEYNYKNADRNVDITFTITAEKTGHQINGVSFDAADYIKTHNGNLKTWDDQAVAATATVINYWVGTPDASGRLSALGVEPFADSKFICGKVTSCYFNCSDCDGVVYANVYYDHNGKSEYVPGSEPTCCKEGKRDIDCDNCGYDTYAENVEPEVVPALQHVYSYELKEAGKITVDGKEVMSYDLIGTCTGNGTEKCTARTLTADDDNTAPAIDELATGIYNVSKKIVKAPNCLEYGKITYTYNVQGIDKLQSKTLLVPKTNHILNGEEVKIDTLTTTTTGIFEMDGEGVTAFKDMVCLGTTKAYFVCEFCETVPGAKKIVAVTVKKEHTVKADTYNVTTYPTCCECDETELATCTHTGSATYDCADPKCSVGAGDTQGKNITVTLPALEHKYDYKIEKKTEGDTVSYVISKVCQNVINANGDICPKSVKVWEDDEEPKVVAHEDATCYAEGYTTYNVTLDGEDKPLTIIHEKVGHTVAGLIYGSEKFNNKYTKTENGTLVVLSTTPGVDVYANDVLDCEESVAGYFECEVCAERGVKALVNIPAVYKDHVPAKVTQEPSCDVAGRAICADCDEAYSIDALGCDFALEYEVTEPNTPKYDGTTAGKVIIKGACKRCGEEYGEQATELTEMTLPALSADNIKDIYGKAVVVKKATCTEKEVLKYTISLNAEGKAIKLTDKESEVFITVSFEVATVAAGHKYENCKTIVVERDELLDEDSEETTKCYYIVNVCTVCGYYDCVDKIEGEEAYAEYLESLENA